MKLKATLERAERDFEGKGHITLLVDWTDALKGFLDDFNGKEITAELKKPTKGRSLDANAYFWKLCGELADKTRQSKDEVYKTLVRGLNVYRPMTIQKEALPTLEKAWSDRGLAWFIDKVDEYETTFRETDKNGKEVWNLKPVCEVRLYYGSSVYNSRQMSRLIDSLVEECKEQGIETLTPAELALLKEDWNGKHTGND